MIFKRKLIEINEGKNGNFSVQHMEFIKFLLGHLLSELFYWSKLTEWPNESSYLIDMSSALVYNILWLFSLEKTLLFLVKFKVDREY